MYKNVLLVGASGDVGKSLLPDLLADPDFQVTILSRTDSSVNFASNINVIRVNYSDKLALIKALTGQDIVISTVGGEALMKNFDKTLIEASLEAGVKWFLPSEYGFDLDDPAASSTPINIPLLENIELLKQNQSRMAYTFISTGAFLDWGLDNGFLGFDIPNRAVTLYDDGKHLVSGTLLKNLGKAVVAILHHPELTLNQRICLADTTFTQEEVLNLLKKYTDNKWTVKHITTEEVLKQAQEDWEKDNWMDAYIAFVLAYAYNGKGMCNFEKKTSNKALGLESITLEQVVKEAVQPKETNA
ncbi:unnamed protein product [Adineta steineri]|uniref:NmrA-like domain-containing protein n=1 Tax=Adineta steineri TaxID=433720 RepID=A0A818R6N3_9BILA|nr:unnamed protein product [Adineta steineri]